MLICQISLNYHFFFFTNFYMFGGWTFKCISADLSLTDHPKIKLSEFDAFFLHEPESILLLKFIIS